MSVYSAKTGLSSILKCYSSTDREKSKAAVINKVRFQEPRGKGLRDALKTAIEHNNFLQLNEFCAYIKECSMNDVDFIRIITEAHSMVHLLSPKFYIISETLLSMQWTNRGAEAVQTYMDFFVDLLVAQIKYINFAISKLILLWIPKDCEAELWPNGIPDDSLKGPLQAIHTLLARILSIIPAVFDVILVNVETLFPYYRKPAHVVVGFMHNVLWLLEYQPSLTEYVMQILIQKLVILDVNAPRDEIEEPEFEEDGMDEDDNEEEMFKMDDKSNQDLQHMNHPIAHTLDMCMDKMFTFFDRFNPKEQADADVNIVPAIHFLKILEQVFDNVILRSHNTHHVQFLIFYFCSFENVLAENFLLHLWSKIKDPNESAVIRQAAVGYMASFLARSKILSLTVMKKVLKELCEWAHQYIRRSDQYRSNGSLKANLVFFSVCQAVFYVIAFRSKDLTSDKKGLLFLQSLQLSALVTCNFNPLRVCLPAVATSFAGITRAYQLAYCHAILERNARRKLATVYAHETATPEEVLDTFFPFDPLILKTSNKRITAKYLQYQGNDAEEEQTAISKEDTGRHLKGEGSDIFDEVDAFLIPEKRQKLHELARSHDSQFTYGLSPGFHI